MDCEFMLLLKIVIHKQQNKIACMRETPQCFERVDKFCFTNSKKTQKSPHGFCSQEENRGIFYGHTWDAAAHTFLLRWVQGVKNQKFGFLNVAPPHSISNASVAIS